MILIGAPDLRTYKPYQIIGASYPTDETTMIVQDVLDLFDTEHNEDEIWMFNSGYYYIYNDPNVMIPLESGGFDKQLFLRMCDVRVL
jgi:hypothetical protein